jgi:uncharacterized protein
VTSAPVDRADRIDSIDVLRGFAVLGILMMNVQDFSMIAAAYSNPAVSGFFTGRDFWLWLFAHVFFDQKFMTIFSLLFGAGIVLFTARVEARDESAAGLHYRRMGWLILFGILHGYFLWSGDILYGYGMCGLWVYLLRHRPPRTLITVGLLLMCVAPLLMVGAGTFLPRMHPGYFQEILDTEWAPLERTVAAERAATVGGWWDLVAFRAPRVLATQTFLLLFWIVWRVGGLMLMGMGLFKLGVFSAARSRRLYAWMVAAGLLVGMALVLEGVRADVAHRWDGAWSMFFGPQWNYAGSVFVALAYVGGVMLACRAHAFAALQRRLAAVGRMALSNYIGQTVVCAVVFHGFAPWTFMQTGRSTQALMVLVVWGLQLALSSWWLERFRFGPLEWLWRSLSYRQLQPFRV